MTDQQTPTPESITTFDGIVPADGSAIATPVYAKLPTGARRGAVILHEIFGRQPEIDRVVDRFAAHGYAAVAPDLFSGGPRLLCLVRAMRAIASGQGPQIEQIRAVRRWLSEKTGLESGSIGLIGFCLGGGFALAAGQGWGAVSTNYGDLPPSEVLRGSGPVIGCYGSRDKLFGKKGAELEARLRPLGVECETHTYPEVGHAFLTDGNHPIASALARPLFSTEYNPAVAAQAWEKIFAFFDGHLVARP